MIKFLNAVSVANSDIASYLIYLLGFQIKNLNFIGFRAILITMYRRKSQFRQNSLALRKADLKTP